jgi:hypothetical protein
MKKLTLIFVSILLITCLAGSVMATDPVNDESLINTTNGIIVAPPGQSTPVTINLFPYSVGGTTVIGDNTYHELMLQLTVTNPEITVTLPTKDWQGNTAVWYANKYSNTRIYTLDSINNVAYLPNQKFTTTSKLVAQVYTSARTSSGSLTANVDRDAHCQYVYIATDTDKITAVPEFPTVALPVAGIFGLLLVFGRKKGDM